MAEWDSFRFELRFDADRLREHIINIEAYKDLYQGKSTRTIVRELDRLQELGFVSFDRQAGSDWQVLINFSAIARY